MQTCRLKYRRMSFNVTQCPACDSTFNTNSRVLAIAAGKVRCGACLNVFEAIDNFLPQGIDDIAHDQDESVFVGNKPEEYFDPSRFLTRSALSEPTQTDETEGANQQHAVLEDAETLGEEFFISVSEEIKSQSPSDERETESPSEDATAIEEPLSLSDRPILDEEPDEAFEEDFLNSFAASEAPEDDPAPLHADAPSVDEPTTEIETDYVGDNASSIEEGIGEGIESSEEIESGSEPADQEQPTSVGIGLSASFSYAPYSPRPQESEKPPSPPIEDEAEPAEDAQVEPVNPEPVRPTPDIPTPAGPREDEPTGDEPSENEEHFHSAVVDQLETEPEPAQRDADIAEPTPPAEQTADVETIEEAADQVETSHPEAEALAESADETPEEDESTEPDNTAVEPEQEEESTEAIRARALEAELRDEEALEAIPRENLAALGMMSTPLELLAGRESRWLHSGLLLLTILLLGSLLSAQFLWQRMDYYNQVPQLRPLYAYACDVMGCELPAFSDIASIRSENLTVRSHPTVENGLMVNTVIRNAAAFEQAFPILILSFNSAANTVIALREFTPAEYLDASLQSVRAMPSMTPVQISLEIMDPGPEAVNYTLAFRLP